MTILLHVFVLFGHFLFSSLHSLSLFHADLWTFFFSIVYIIVIFQVQDQFHPHSAFRKMRPIFCGNFEYDARQSDLERVFSKYGKVDRVDMKSGECLYFKFFSFSMHS